MARLFKVRGLVLCATIASLAILLARAGAEDPDQASPSAGHQKCVYSGPNGTFHVLKDGGTAYYYLWHRHHGGGGEEECWVRKPHLGMLHGKIDGKKFVYYRASEGDPHTTWWAFERHSTDCGLHVIWRGTVSASDPTEVEWRRFGCFCLEVLHD